MHADTEEFYKHRIIQFCRFPPGIDQANLAAEWLRDVAGVEITQPQSSHTLEIVYDLRHVTLQGIENALMELGYHLDNSLMCKLGRALFHYAEETQRENWAVEQDGTVVQQDVFVNRYEHVAHGCRDPQPEYWREYQ